MKNRIRVLHVAQAAGGVDRYGCFSSTWIMTNLKTFLSAHMTSKE